MWPFHLLKILGQVRVLFPTDTLLLHSTKTVHSHVQVTTCHNLTLSNLFLLNWNTTWLDTPDGEKETRLQPCCITSPLNDEKEMCLQPWCITSPVQTEKNYINHLSQWHPPITHKKIKGFEETQLLAFTQKEYVIKYMKNHAWKVPP